MTSPDAYTLMPDCYPCGICLCIDSGRVGRRSSVSDGPGGRGIIDLCCVLNVIRIMRGRVGLSVIVAGMDLNGMSRRD